MTSSRSFRASIMPSMLRSNTDPDSSSSTRKSVKKSNTSDLAHLRGSNIGSSKSTTNLPHMGSNSQQDQDAVQHNRPRSAEQKTIRKRNDSTQKVSLPKSQSTTNLSPTKGSTRWRNRLSSFLPSLVLPSEPTPKSVPTPPVPAAPSASASAVTAAVSPAPTKSSSPTDTSTTTNTAATPPTTVDDSASSTTPSIIDPTVRMTSDYHDALTHQAHGQYQPGHAGSPPSPDSIPTRGSDSLDGSLNPQPQIMAPIPPSPEVQRATMSPQEPNMPPPPIPTSPSDNVSSGSGKLRKENPAARSRSGSLQHTSSNSNGDSIQALKTRQTSPVPDRGRRSSSVQSPNSRNNNTKSRVVSTPLAIRPGSSKGDASQSPTRGRLRRSWLPGGRSRSNSMDVSNTSTSTAWVLSDDTQAEYNASFLKNGEKVPELWNESGAVLVYLYPKGSGFGPSFKVQEFTISSSWVFNELIQREREMPMGRDRTRSFSGRDSLTAEDANRFISPPNSPPAPDDGYDDCLHLYLPNGTPGQETPPDMGRLIAIRNLFAFLTGQPLVATKARPTNFHAFLEISKLLEEYGFTSYDGTTFGDAVDLSFGFYMDQHALADCRNSREKTLEALILGERMRSADLYNEAFAHAAGKLPAIQDLKLPLWNQVSEKTRTNLERASTDLNNRQHNANMHLEQFEFPALFSGIANSTSMSELRSVRFKVWKQSFTKMRNFALSYYKTAFGNWPPKASSKKNPFSESGLNRLVLKVLYSDMCALYDLLVDRTNRTSRIMDAVPELSNDPDKMIMSALRNIMSEFDRSKPPVLPPIPYDCPQLPTATSILETYDTLSPKKQAKFDKSIKEHELMLMLNKAYNYDTNATKVPFLDKFKEFELREARGKTPQDFADQRIGYWLFLYVVIQSLPVLVVDAPGMQFTEGVEYFLCEPPLGNPPWVPDQQVKKMWYEVAGTGGLVELSQDAVLFSVEATYHRSHCWLAATQWESGASGLQAQAPTEPSLSPLQPPRSMFLDEDFMPTPPPSFGNGYNTPPSPIGSPSGSLRPRTHSPGGSRANQAWRSSIALGLEPVPLQPPSPFGERSSSLGGRPPSLMMGSRNSSVGNLAAFGHQGFPQTESPPPEQTGATFDDILRSDAMKKEKKKSRFF
ncbi:hypothetical protein FOMA001_g985 [Fusarium oxysporum f. sp. matthiolae]|nr:hypothetical protein FOMA001_g985 [Fusarium oxysporum f. sp. matthiolae]